MYICTYVCVCVCVSVCMYVCMYVCMHASMKVDLAKVYTSMPHLRTLAELSSFIASSTTRRFGDLGLYHVK